MDVLLKDGRVAEVAPPNKIKGGADRQIRCPRTHRRARLHRSARPPARARPGLQRDDRDGHRRRRRRRIYFCLHHAQHGARRRFGGVDRVASSARTRRGRQCVCHRRRDPSRARAPSLTDFRALQAAGAIAVTDDGKPILDDDIMREALVLGGELNLPVVQHAEDTRMTENCSMHCGRAFVPPRIARHDRGCRSLDRRARRAARDAHSQCPPARRASFHRGRAEKRAPRASARKRASPLKSRRTISR